MSETRPNFLVIMTDEERYPPPYEAEAVARFRRDKFPARERLRAQSVEFHRHYAASTACLPSRASLFTGHYPSLHGVTATDGLAKAANDPGITWLDPDGVPTMGDWFRAAGYRTHYRGKWHISHADLIPAGSHRGLMANDRAGTVDPEVVDLYRRADRLEGFGFSGWIGREPHGPHPADTGFIRDPLFADQVCELFAELAADDADPRPFLAVASFVNPHDIVFSGLGWDSLGFPAIDDGVPDVGEAPSQADGFDGRPDCHRRFRDLWPQLLYPQPADDHYRRFYLWLHQLVDRAIERILDALDASGLAETTIVVFTSDHGDLVGAHGGMQQKWYTAFDEAIRVPLLVSGPGISASTGGVSAPTSHIDLLPTLLGLAGVDPASLVGQLAEHHVEVRELVGRDLRPAIVDPSGASWLEDPVYFTTEDRIDVGLRHRNRFTGEPFTPVAAPANIESVIVPLPDGEDGAPRLWKLSQYYDRLEEWEASHEVSPRSPDGPEVVPSQWELYDLSRDPEERNNLWSSPDAPVDRLRSVLESTREDNRRVPLHRRDR
ncbi:MAG TPA: sulfatase-like hydrolase/transferase [Acidimicrobiales bacterium]|jgi:arylsulfatase A-like enzyme|nr:sulfatase-like hydrolase/transferase [Acidimicrobiales bacterium]